MTGVMSPGSGRALRLDPHALPVRYAARDSGADGHIRDIELDRDRVVLKRAVAGIAMRVGVPVNEFSQGKINATVQELKEERDAVKELGLI